MITSEYKKKIMNLDQSGDGDTRVGNSAVLEEVLPSFGNYTVQVRSFNLIKESPRHGETDFEATLDLNVCTMEEVYKFIEAFEESSFTSLNVHQGDQMLGNKTILYARRHCQHSVLKKRVTQANNIYIYIYLKKM